MTDAWGRWGKDDEAGALNHIGAAEVRRAAGLVKRGEVFRLAQPLSAQMDMPGQRPGLMHFMTRDGGDYAAGANRPGGFQMAEDCVVLPLHIGTHIDGLCHAWCDDLMYNGHSGYTVRSRGAGKLGVDTLPAVVTRGVLLDFVRDGIGLPDGTPITADMVGQALDRAGVALVPGDAVLLRTGWMERQTGSADFNAEPGLNAAAARHLAEAGVALVGADNYAIEVLPFPPGEVFPVHQLLLRNFGVPLLEGLVLRPLAEAGESTFLFTVAALPIKGATGSPVCPVAVL